MHRKNLGEIPYAKKMGRDFPNGYREGIYHSIFYIKNLAEIKGENLWMI